MVVSKFLADDPVPYTDFFSIFMSTACSHNIIYVYLCAYCLRLDSMLYDMIIDFFVALDAVWVISDGAGEAETEQSGWTH